MLTLQLLIRYGIFGIPLAFAGLPIYVHVPKFYADTFQIDLGTLGIFLLIMRSFDALSDPLIGFLSDHWHKRRRILMGIGAAGLALGYVALFNPIAWAFLHPFVWLALCLSVVYLCFSVLMINYYGMGADLAQNYHEHTRIASFRESFMLVGVLLASILPTFLQSHFDNRHAFGIFGLLLVPIMIVGAITCFPLRVPLHETRGKIISAFSQLLHDTDIRWILGIGLCNTIPTAITSTLFLFFTASILHAETYSGPLLALYFLSAAAGMPLWVRLSKKFGKRLCLLIAMIMATICFMWTATLGAGDIIFFAIICVLSGMTIGADAIILPSLIGDALTNKRQLTASAFGLWNFVSKMAMAGAAGIALPLLGAAHYHTDKINSPSALQALSFCYALAPCAFKVVAIMLLYLSPLDQKRGTHEPFNS